MSLDSKQIDFFLERINKADVNTFIDIVKQLFNYLTKEASSNTVYTRYERAYPKFSYLKTLTRYQWYFPDDLSEAKIYCYALYRLLTEQNGSELPIRLFHRLSSGESIVKFNETFLPYFRQTLDDILNAEKTVDYIQKLHGVGNKIFIIHGHDNEMKREVQLLLERAGLEDVVLHECPDKGRTLIAKLIEEGAFACYVVALLSPDDTLVDGQTRARQNVILEIGYFLGKLGKERVRLLKKGSVEIPSDLQGVLYENYDESGAWKAKLLKEIHAVGIEVDIEKAIAKF